MGPPPPPFLPPKTPSQLGPPFCFSHPRFPFLDSPGGVFLFFRGVKLRPCWFRTSSWPLLVFRALTFCGLPTWGPLSLSPLRKGWGAFLPPWLLLRLAARGELWTPFFLSSLFFPVFPNRPAGRRRSPRFARAEKGAPHDAQKAAPFFSFRPPAHRLVWVEIFSLSSPLRWALASPKPLGPKACAQNRFPGVTLADVNLWGDPPRGGRHFFRFFFFRFSKD